MKEQRNEAHEQEGTKVEAKSRQEILEFRNQVARTLSFATNRYERYVRLSKRRSAKKLSFEKLARNHRRTEAALHVMGEAEMLIMQVDAELERGGTADSA